MTDAELIAGLRDLAAVLGKEAFTCAADRIEALIAERDEATRRRDAWKAKAEGYDAVRKALREKVGAPWPPNLSRALWAGIAADEKKRADDAEAKLEELRQALLWCSGSADFNEGGVAREGWLKVCAPLLRGENHD